MNRFPFLILLVCFSGLLATVAEAQKVHWPVAQGGNGHWYEAAEVATRIDWGDANVGAIAAGGHLASITSAAENNFVFQLIDDPRFWVVNGPRLNGPWLGGKQAPGSPEPAGGFGWVDGEPFQFTAWFPGEPNNLASACANEDAVHFHSSSAGRAATWNDATSDPCSVGLLGYVIEYELTLEKPQPGQAGQLNDFTARWASPGEKLYFTYGFQAGTTSVPGCAPGLDIDSAILFGVMTANTSGTATLNVYVPPKASGRTVLLQAYELASCRASDAVTHTFN